MKDEDKTKEQLIGELKEMRRRLAELEASESECKKAEEILQKSEERYRRITEAITDYIYTVRVEERRPVETTHSEACFAVTGYTKYEFAADPYLWIRMVAVEDHDLVRQQIEQVLSGHFPQPIEHRIIRKDGVLRWVESTVVPHHDLNGSLISYDGIVRDVTERKKAVEERKKLEEHLRQAHKMEAVGQLAGGIAHDFNNILSAIIGYASLLRMKMRKDDQMKANVDQIIASAERAANLTRSLLAYSRKQLIIPRPVDLNEIVWRIEKLLLPLIGEDIDFRTKLTENNLTVLADGAQIEQVLMSLATNSRDAMPRGGQIIIETGAMELDGDFVSAHPYIIPGAYAVISFTDTGAGMDEDIMGKIFDPFFTTKEVGKGTGLGLAMSYGIIKQHNGYIDVFSEPGRGTTFKIYLPLMTVKPQEAETPQMPVAFKAGLETILIAEDDKAVREIMNLLLTEFGYSVIAAKDGEEAVNKFIKNKDRIDLLLFDAVMPKKNGREAYEAVKEIRPDIKALFVSGYTADIMHSKGLLGEGLHFISKPVSPTELLEKIREVLLRNK
ncbi:MAG: response regulator [Nitrospirae bacterium]|nr:response regulator [Nitrospirota bacterium]